MLEDSLISTFALKFKHLQIMKKKLISVTIVTIVAIVVGTILLKANVEPKKVCDGTISGLKYYCTNEVTERCSYVDGGIQGETNCYGKFYLDY